MKIILKEHDEQWKKDFSIIKYKIKQKLLIIKKNAEIRHIGSTSVKKLIAKPIIDVLIGVSAACDLDKYINPMTDLGFIYMKEYEDEIPNRRFFYKEEQNKRIAHVHLVYIESLWFKRHIAFRDELRNNRSTRKNYENLKKNLSKREWKDGNEYSEAKTEFIRNIENKIL